jgi:glycosyltransferase involved in cell wall biosynthesis
MDRYADAIQSTVHPGIHVRSFELWPAGRRPNRPRRQLRQWVTGPMRLRRAGGDVIHLIDHSEAHLLRILKTGRTVVTCHDLLMLQALAGELPYAPPRLWASRFHWSVSYLARAAAVVCVSEATRKDVVRFLDVDPGRLHVIHQAAGEHFHPPTPAHRERVRTDLGAGDRRLVLHVSSGGFYKNNTAVIRVVAELRRGGLNVALVRAGAPLSEEESSLVSHLGLEGNVFDEGWVSDQRLNDLYGAADLLLFPSTGEGFGWPVLEAMTCGLPVVASSIPVLEELVGDSALVAGPLDITGLSNAACAVLSDPATSESLRRSGLARASGYRWDQALGAYADLYRRVADCPAPDAGGWRGGRGRR